MSFRFDQANKKKSVICTLNAYDTYLVVKEKHSPAAPSPHHLKLPSSARYPVMTRSVAEK